MRVRTGPQGSWFHPANSLPEFWSVKHRLVHIQIAGTRWKFCLGTIRTVCMRWMDLELCARDTGCKNWPKRELVPPYKFSSWVSWSVKHRLVLPPNYRHKMKFCLGIIGLSTCTEWILSFVQEIFGLRTGPKGSWFRPANSLPEFWSVKHRLVHIQIAGTRWKFCLGTIRTFCMRWMDLELCARDTGCKNWPTRELVPPRKFSSWVSWSVRHRLVLHPNYRHKMKSCLGTIGLSTCWMDRKLCTRHWC